MKGIATIAAAVISCGVSLNASASIYSDNVQSANSVLSGCVVLNIGSKAQTVKSITIYYYDAELHPHVLTKTTGSQVVQPGDAVFVQSDYSVPNSEGFLVPSTSCAVVTSDDADFRAAFALADTNGNTVLNEPLR
jgi:hypothetical protein